MVQWPGGQRSCEVWTGGSIFAEMFCCKIHPGNLLNWKQGARMCPKISWLIMVDDHFPMVSQNWLKGWRQESDVSPCLTSVFGAKHQASFRQFEFSQRNRSIESLHSIYSMRWFQSVSNRIFSYIFIYFSYIFPIFSLWAYDLVEDLNRPGSDPVSRWAPQRGLAQLRLGSLLSRHSPVPQRSRGPRMLGPEKPWPQWIQGLVNVPFWGFWISPSNICWNLYPQ